MSEPYDLIIIGAGPAGMAAADISSRHDCRVLILDEQSSPGGQLFRSIEAFENRQRPELGDTYRDGLRLTKAFRNTDVEYISQATVWLVSSELEVGFSKNGQARIVTAKQIIIATGAQERPFPVSGWTLPGVMTIGAAQVLLKESEIAIEDAVFAGTGPLFYLALHQYLAAGISIKAIIDLTPASNYLRALPHIFKAIPGLPKILEGWQWKREIVKSGVPYFSGVTDIRIIGRDAVTGIEYLKGSEWQLLTCENVLLHQGVVPNVNISMAAGCASSWNKRQACWTIDVDEWFRSSIADIAVVGDGAAIGGGAAAELNGRIAALAALEQLDKISPRERDSQAKPYKAALKSELSNRPFLDTLFRPVDHFRIPQQPETIVCRCEEISVGQIRDVVESGCAGPNQLKSYSRCGMGPCQGRLCGLTVSELIAGIMDKPVSDVGYYRLRSPIKPLLLGELANLDLPSES